MIAAIVLAAGQSKRMGKPKMLLPWGYSTIVAHVVQVLEAAGVEDILVVTGAESKAVENACKTTRARFAHNDDYVRGEMLSSIKVGLGEMLDAARATLVALGDQPQVLESTIRLVTQQYASSGALLVVPSHGMHRGHPWLVDRQLWGEILKMEGGISPRDFLNDHSRDIHYVEIDSASILEDVDTPDDYARARAKAIRG